MYAYMYVCMHVCMYVCVCVYSKETWQREWETTNKGRTTKEYFPNVVERLQEKKKLNTKLYDPSYGSRELKILPSQVQNHRSTGLPMWKR